MVAYRVCHAEAYGAESTHCALARKWRGIVRLADLRVSDCDPWRLRRQQSEAARSRIASPVRRVFLVGERLRGEAGGWGAGHTWAWRRFGGKCELNPCVQFSCGISNQTWSCIAFVTFSDSEVAVAHSYYSNIFSLKRKVKIS